MGTLGNALRRTLDSPPPRHGIDSEAQSQLDPAPGGPLRVTSPTPAS